MAGHKLPDEPVTSMPECIGVCWMEEDGMIKMRLRSEDPGGPAADVACRLTVFRNWPIPDTRPGGRCRPLSSQELPGAVHEFTP